jgi:hypothetical protein
VWSVASVAHVVARVQRRGGVDRTDEGLAGYQDDVFNRSGSVRRRFAWRPRFGGNPIDVSADTFRAGTQERPDLFGLRCFYPLPFANSYDGNGVGYRFNEAPERYPQCCGQ